ncbi:TetR/AcrR family transcriptional regulator [Prosthecomicrobium hirschii]|uniref:TetR/AcrR family transcriptional regulator n=1 Tax=Prosthecodimorpha hirschii TaxID=665126 RepID=UPI00222099BF|nr:TetR/AcrR family transcriptional regulator [Prosthecomicrobium hirschii]MCW1839489.1 TetR/AcrR family transcriptional regulator [Prosthecomicrobium hirschii]
MNVRSPKLTRSLAAAAEALRHALGGCTAGQAETPHDQRRRQILAAARSCFARSGFHGASMQEICSAAQMSPGGLYRYFRSKDEMIDAIVEEQRLRNVRLLGELSGPGPLTDRLVSIAMVFVREMSELGSVALMTEVYAESFRNSALGEKFLSNENEVRNGIRTFMEQQMAEGRIAPTHDLEAVLSFMCGMMDGVVMRMAFDGALSPERIEPLLREVVVTLLRPDDTGLRPDDIGLKPDETGAGAPAD